MAVWTLLDVYKKDKKIRQQWYRLGEIPSSTDEIVYAPTMRYELFPTGINPNHEPSQKED